MIISKISGNAIFWGIFMIMPLFGCIAFTFRILHNFTFSIRDVSILLLFIFLFYLGINFLKHIKYITIEDTRLRYYSILKPFGKIIDLSSCMGKILLQETGSGGSYKVLYLIDKKNMTSFKIMGLHYKNFDELNSAIDLKVIRFTPSTLQYLQLLFFEKLNINSKKDNDRKITPITLKVFKLISIIGIILFIIGFILKRTL